MHEQSAASLEYIRVAVSASEAGVAVNPTADAVQMAFVAVDTVPISGDYVAATWEVDNGTYYARCLVGPGGTIALAADHWDVWVEITDTPEIPARKAGRIRITP